MEAKFKRTIQDHKLKLFLHTFTRHLFLPCAEAAMPLSSSPSKWLPIISFPTDHFYNSNLLMVTFSAVHHFHDVPAVLGIWFTKAIKMAQIADLLLATVLLAIALLWSSTALTIALDNVALSAAFYIVFIVRYHLSL
jgi:hypothetical protein